MSISTALIEDYFTRYAASLTDFGNDLTDSTSFYLLRGEESDLRACVCIETDAAAKIRALATERGIDLGAPAPTNDDQPETL